MGILIDNVFIPQSASSRHPVDVSSSTDSNVPSGANRVRDKVLPNLGGISGLCINKGSSALCGLFMFSPDDVEPTGNGNT